MAAPFGLEPPIAVRKLFSPRLLLYVEKRCLCQMKNS